MAKTYIELLRDPRWQRKRLEVMSRDQFRCLQCGSKVKTLNVHHQYYIKGRMPWEYSNDSLLTLCEDCHHGINTHDWVKAFLDLGLTPFDLIHLASLIAYKQSKMRQQDPEYPHGFIKYQYYDLEFTDDSDYLNFADNFEYQYKAKYKNG